MKKFAIFYELMRGGELVDRNFQCFNTKEEAVEYATDFLVRKPSIKKIYILSITDVVSLDRPLAKIEPAKE